jgi:hypothetical protein
MGIETLTDEAIAKLLALPKRVENPAARERTEGQHRRRDYQVVSLDGDQRFTLFTRQSTRILDGFSAGLRWHAKSGEDVMLIRCNGSDHPHPNVLERERIESRCHVHILTERYIQANRKGEGFAEATSIYRTLEGALHTLVTRANIRGLNIEADGPMTEDLFGDIG